MNNQLFTLLRIMADARVRAMPLRMLRELRRRGISRLPDEVGGELQGGMPRGRTFSFARRWLDGERITRHDGQWVLNSFLPPFPGPAYDRLFENLLSGRRLSPVSAFLAVTEACPYSCWHCSYAGRRPKSRTSAQWLETIDELHGLGASIIGFTGGEPGLREDLPDLVRAASRGAATILFTSGGHLGEGEADAFAAEMKAAGLWALCVSLDAVEPGRHDEMRGSDGAFDRAVKMLRAASRHGLYTMIGAVGTPRFVDEREYEKLHELAGHLGVDELRIVEAMPCGKLLGCAGGTLLSPDQVRELRDFHVRMNRQGARPKVCAFNQIESPEVFGCGAGTQHMFIDASGNVCPCDFTPLGFGRVGEVPLAEIWERMTEAMINPRRRCFIQANRELVAGYAKDAELPLPYTVSREVCARAPHDGLPDFFLHMRGDMGTGRGDDG